MGTGIDARNTAKRTGAQAPGCGTLIPSSFSATTQTRETPAMADRIPCGSCRAFKRLPTEAYGEGLSGECRRHAPAFTCDTTRRWPIVKSHDWCLEAEPLKIGEAAR